jgi:hypothetical protein
MEGGQYSDQLMLPEQIARLALDQHKKNKKCEIF